MADIWATLRAELELLREVAATSGDARLSAVLVAAGDDSVQKLIVTKLEQGHVYTGTQVSRHGGHVQVVFTFARAEGMFGLVPLSLLVTVDLPSRRVAYVADHHLPAADVPATGPGALQPELDLSASMQERPGAERLRLARLRLVQGFANGPDTYWV